MPDNTPRGYPYSIPSDPADVPAAMEALAEAIDGDVGSVAATVRPRRAFRVSGFSPVSFSTAFTTTNSYTLPMEVNDFIIGDAIDPINTPTTTIFPKFPGFWLFRAEIVYSAVGGSLMERVTIELYRNISFFALNGTCRPIVFPDPTATIPVEAGTYCSGTDYISLRASATQNTGIPDGPPMVLRERSLFGMQMTES